MFVLTDSLGGKEFCNGDQRRWVSCRRRCAERNSYCRSVRALGPKTLLFIASDDIGLDGGLGTGGGVRWLIQGHSHRHYSS